MTLKPKRLRFKPRLLALACATAAVLGILAFASTGGPGPLKSLEAGQGTSADPTAGASIATAPLGSATSEPSGSTGPSAPAPRGRARVKNGTLVSDQGTPLRGGTLWFVPEADSQYEWATSSSPWPFFAEYHLNTVRLAIEYGPRQGSNDPLSLSGALADIDTAVQEAIAHHLYAVIDLHWSSGEHDQPSAFTFWQNVASRYKDDTNVIYELMNEPVAWNPKNYTARDIADEEALYHIVRAGAPQTPVLMMTFPIPENNDRNPKPTMTDVTQKLTGIDWSNTVVAFHGYWVANDAGEKQLKEKYPVIESEFELPSTSSGEDQAVDHELYQIQVMEKDKISWICWNCLDNAPDTSSLPGMESDAKAKGYWWPADA